jgi:hypothetical protein
LRRELEDEMEFTTIMQFESIEDVKKFAGGLWNGLCSGEGPADPEKI